LKILFFGSSYFSVYFLEKLYSSGHKVAAVVTNIEKGTGRGKKIIPNPVKVKAEELGSKCFEIKKMDEEIYNKLLGLNFDGLVIVSFGHIIPQKVIDLSNDRAINVHPSLLPKYRGPSPIITSLTNGDEETGVTIMKINEGLDTGNIFTQARFKISMNDNQEILENNIIEIGAPLLISTLNLIEKGLIESFPQIGKASYTKVFKKEDFRINWSESSFVIRNKIRAFSPEPGAFTFLNSLRIKILNAAEYDCPDEDLKKLMFNDDCHPGTIICADKINGLIVKCANNEAIRILELKIEGKKRIYFLDFLNGYKLKTGDSFK
jgi:methionyl-tRNA formyltransferase